MCVSIFHHAPDTGHRHKAVVDKVASITEATCHCFPSLTAALKGHQFQTNTSQIGFHSHGQPEPQANQAKPMHTHTGGHYRLV